MASPRSYAELSPAEQDQYLDRLKDRFKLPVRPTYRQAIVLVNPARGLDQPTLFGGAKGGAKTALLAMCGISACRLVAENRAFLARRTAVSFKASTLQELLKQQRFVPDMVHRPGSSKFVFTDNGSELWYGGVGDVKDIEKHGSTEFGFIGIDEATETDRLPVHELTQRLRHLPATKAHAERILYTGNPFPSWVKEDFYIAPKPGYIFIRSLMRDNPHLAPGYEEQMRNSLTEEEVKAYIEGDWDALGATDQVLQDLLLMVACTDPARLAEVPDYSDPVWGVDVSRKGTDWTRIYARYGFVWEYIDGWQGERITDTANRMATIWEAMPPGMRPRRINVDDSGMAGLTDVLRQMVHTGEFGKQVVIGEVIGGGKPHDTIHYANMNAELIFTMKAILTDRGRIPNDPDLRLDLGAFWYHWVGSRKAVDSNEVIRGRIGRSPDRGNAFLYTLFEPPERPGYVPKVYREDPAVAALDGMSEDEQQQELLRLEGLRRRERMVDTFYRSIGKRRADDEEMPY